MIALQTMKATAVLPCLLAAVTAAPQHFTVWSHAPRPVARPTFAYPAVVAPVHPATRYQYKTPSYKAPASVPAPVFKSAALQPFNSLQSVFRQAAPAPAFSSSETTNFLADFNRKGNNILDADIVRKTRQAAENAKTLLTSLKNNATYAPLVVKALESSNCLDNIDDAIAAVEASAKMVEDIAPTFQAMRGQRDILVLTRSSAAMLRRLDSIMPRLDRYPLNLGCAAPAAGQPGQLSDLDSLLQQFATFIPASSNIRPARFSALISQTQAFLAKVKRSTARLQDGQLCARGDFQNTIFTTVEEIMTDLSEFLTSVNADQSGSVRSQSAQFQQKFQQMFQQVAAGLNTAGLQQSCSLGTTDISTAPLSTLAQTLDDLAVIIEDVGVETLSQELGFDLDFNFDSIDFNL